MKNDLEYIGAMKRAYQIAGNNTTYDYGFDAGFDYAQSQMASNSNNMTLRQYYAGIAMQATDLEAYANKYGHKWAERVAADSVSMADALIAELEKPTS